MRGLASFYDKRVEKWSELTPPVLLTHTQFLWCISVFLSASRRIFSQRCPAPLPPPPSSFYATQVVSVADLFVPTTAVSDAALMSSASLLNTNIAVRLVSRWDIQINNCSSVIHFLVLTWSASGVDPLSEIMWHHLVYRVSALGDRKITIGGRVTNVCGLVRVCMCGCMGECDH